MATVLNESQLRAAVAVAEARREYDERIAKCVELSRVANDETINDETRARAWIARKAAEEMAGAAMRREDAASREWAKVRPAGEIEVRSVETLERIVSDRTDGGEEFLSRDTLLAEIVREFRGMTERDGVA